jgi:hypothetical protein
VFQIFLGLLHRPQSDGEMIAMDLNEAHRHIIGLPSLLGNPYYPDVNNLDYYPPIPFAVRAYAASFCQCFTELTHSKSWWMFNGWTAASGSQLAAHKAIRTSYFALNFLRKYIQLNPHSHANVHLAGILFNAILEVVGLPSLDIDFADEKWAYYTLKAVDGDMELLLERVLEKLVVVLAPLAEGRP